MCAKLLIFHWNQDKCPRSYCLIGDFIVILEIRRWIIHVSSRALRKFFPEKPFNLSALRLFVCILERYCWMVWKANHSATLQQPFRQKIFTKSWIVFPKPLIVFRKCLKFFVTNFVTLIQNCWIYIQGFWIHVTNFVTKTFLYDRKNYLADSDNYLAENNNYLAESGTCNVVHHARVQNKMFV